MCDFTGSWGYINDSIFVVEAQRADFIGKNLTGATMYCTGMDEAGNLLLVFKNDVFTAMPAGFHNRPAPTFSWGDQVRIIPKSIDGIVVEICWHYTEQRYFYHVQTRDGKRLKKRFYPKDLERIEP